MLSSVAAKPEFLTLRGWVLFIGTESILAGILWAVGRLTPFALIIFGVLVLAGLWLWENRKAIKWLRNVPRGELIASAFLVVPFIISMFFVIPAIYHLYAMSEKIAIAPETKTLTEVQPTERIFINKTIVELFDEYHASLASRAELQFAPYVGKWVHITAVVENIIPQDLGEPNVVLNIDPADERTIKLTSAVFAKTQRGRLSVVEKGQAISIVCRIDRFYMLIVWLADCEFDDL